MKVPPLMVAKQPIETCAKWLVPLVICMLATSCATVYTIALNPEKKAIYGQFTQALENGRYIEASTAYTNGMKGDDASTFEKASDPFVEQLILGIREHFAPKFAEAENALKKAEVLSSNPENWEETRSILNNQRELLQRFKQHSHRSDHMRWVPYAKLKNFIEATTGVIQDRAILAFAQENVPTIETFFQRYPVPLNGRKVIGANLQQFNTHISSLSDKGLVDLSKYWTRETIGADYFTQLEKSYVRQRLQKNRAAGFEGFAAILETIANCRSNRLPCDYALTGYAVKRNPKTSRFDFPVQIDLELKLLDADDVASWKKVENDELGVILAVVEANLREKTTKTTKVSSRFLSGTREAPNPAYQQAISRVNQAQTNYQIARDNFDRADYNNKLSPSVASAFLSGMASGTLQNSRTELQNAQAALSRTPLTISKPVYTDYSFEVVSIDVVKNAKIIAGIWNDQKGAFETHELSFRDSNTLKVAPNMHAKEVKYANNYLLPAQLSDYERKALVVGPSDFINYKLKKKAIATKTASLDTAMATILNRDAPPAATPKRATKARPSKLNLDAVVTIKSISGDVVGAGFYIRDGYVLTNEHVVNDRKFVEIGLRNGNDTFGKVVATDIARDLALIQAEAKQKPLALYSGSALEAGSESIAVGHPKGLIYTLSRGIVSATRQMKGPRSVGSQQVFEFVQTDTALSPGNSGGPLIVDNQVIGVNSWKYIANEDEGLGFAISWNEVRTFLDSYVDN